MRKRLNMKGVHTVDQGIQAVKKSLEDEDPKACRIGILSIEFDEECGGIPIAIIGDLETKEEYTYLTPFRRYSFQCSGDRKGHGDSGSTPVFGIANILESESPNKASTNLYWYETQIELVKAMACTAVQHFADRNNCVFSMDYGLATDEAKKPLRNGRLTNFWFPSMLDRFVAESIIWVMHGDATRWTRENDNK